jgi:CRP-like cAMP-binding protein
MLNVADEQRNVRNRLLRALPAADYERLRPEMKPVKFELGEVLCEAGDPLPYAWFVTRGIASLVSTTADGSAIEVGMVGNEGVVGLPVLLKGESLPYRVNVQLAGDALRVPISILRKEFSCQSALHQLFLRYTFSLIVQFTQSGVCNHFHTIEERLCRWLLILHDHAQSDTVNITQELLSEMLGVRRSGISLVAGALQRAGFISYCRGRITILNREAMEAGSCECYRVVKDEFEDLFADLPQIDL